MLTFWRYGYETTSIADLTTAMGVTAPSIYTAYGDKKHLFLEAVRLYAGSSEELEKTLFGAETAHDAAYEMLVGSATAFTGEMTPRGCLLASATASGSKDAVDVQDAVSEVRRGIQAQLSKRIEKDVTEGILPKTTNHGALASMVIALIQGMSVLARDGADRPTLLAIVQTAMQAWPAEARST